jgi:hypothetical protein
MTDVRTSALRSARGGILWALAALAVLLGPPVGAPAAQQRAPGGQRGTYGWVQIFTNYDAVVTVDGEPYPTRSANGLKIAANKRHAVHVKMGDKEKDYVVVVQPRELRTLLVDISGYQTPPPAVAATPSTDRSSTPTGEAKEEEGENGKLTVYSKPKGDVYVDGAALGAATPMINRELEVGRHEVQVKWESGDMSEVKTVRIRRGSKLKLFFRDRENKLGQP